ncbi:actin-like protein arp-6 [Ophiostoma piceae UAMH 11346]|uniref:Actin-like protein arp-6 n=1 Tax=Ophiostoma piceae (strain UAMH 11346) TaxID=1262450 RepID=S3C4X1_OPHP1|nr:actin-like protein arp-6 [Ophiostoma piceae UAMH 11346]
MAAGRKGKPTAPPPPQATLVVDNGGYTIKAGFAGDDSGKPVVVPNCIARDRHRRTYIGAELAQCRDFGEAVFRRPVDRGYIVNWDTQRAIWDNTWGESSTTDTVKAQLAHDPADTRLVLTEQPNGLPALQTNCDQMVFEEFQFSSYYRGTAAQFNAYLDLSEEPTTSTDSADPADKADPADNADKKKTSEEATPPPAACAELRLVVDVGYSFSTVTPVLRGRPIHRAVRRLDVGGKLLTNYLTKLLSVRHYDMRHDAYIVNEMKEKACFVSLDFAADLEKTWRGPREALGDMSASKRRRLDLWRSGSDGIAKEYVLPDYYGTQNPARAHGVVRDYDAAAERARKQPGGNTLGEDVIVLRNERFSVPELLFNPSDIGLQQPGLPELISQSIRCLPVGLWPAALANIVVVGGSAELPGLAERLQKEVQALMPHELVVRVTRPADPLTCTWRGAARFASLPENEALLKRACVTKQEYEEHGAAWVARKFAAGLGEFD